MGAAILGVQGIWQDRPGYPTCHDVPVALTPAVTSLWVPLPSCPISDRIQLPVPKFSGTVGHALGPSSHPEILLNLPKSAGLGPNPPPGSHARRL